MTHSFGHILITGTYRRRSLCTQICDMQKNVEDYTEDGFANGFKGAAVALAVVALIPIFIPTAACVLAFTEIKEKFKKCPRCSSRNLIFKGVEDHGEGGCLEVRGTFLGLKDLKELCRSIQEGLRRSAFSGNR